MKTRLLLWMVALTLLVWASPAQAHGYILRAIPPDRAVLERPPTRLQYSFSEDLEARFSSLILRDSQGNVLLTGGVDEAAPSVMRLAIPPGTLADGAYVVELRPAFASDGHATVQTQVFFVGDVATDLQSQAASQAAQPLEVLWKTLLLSGTSLLFGLFMLYLYVLRPVWGNPRYVVGGLPPRLMRRLNGLAGLGLALALLGQGLALWQQTMTFFNVDAATALGLLDIVRVGSRFGDVWNVRMLLLALFALLFGLSVYYSARAPRSVAGFWAANVWVLALIVGAQAVASHASGSLVMPWVGVAMHWLHSLAVAFWVGGIAALVLILPPALSPYQGAQRQTALLAVMMRFSRLTVGAVAVVVGSGIYNSSQWFFSADDWQSGYGSSLLLKLLMVGGLLVVGALHHLAIRPALAQRLGARWGGLWAWAGRFNGSMRLEGVLALSALALAAALSSTPIPQPAFLQSNAAPPSATEALDGLQVSTTLAPATLGLNSVDVVVESPAGDPINDASVRVQMVYQALDIHGTWQAAELAEDGLYVATNDTVERLGAWLVLVDVQQGERVQRAVFPYAINSDGTRSLPATWVNVLAGLGVLAALAYVLFPSAQALYARLNLAPQSLLVAGGITAITIVLLLFAVWFTNEQVQRNEAARRPVPAFTNPTLPDAASLARGAALYQQHCIIWQSVTDFRILLRQTNGGQLGDATLFTATRAGWRDVPPCNGDLDDAQRWDIVNFFRSFAHSQDL